MSPEQTSAVPGRSIHDNLTLVRDVIEYSRMKQGKGIMLGLDQHKAFDAVNRQFLFDALKIMGLEEEVIIVAYNLKSYILICDVLCFPLFIFLCYNKILN